MTERTTEADQQLDAPTSLMDLPHGTGLNANETAAITRRALTSVVLFAGTAESGKTTLLATLHLLFQKGPFAGYNFAGSDTLVGFEDRVRLTRTASGRTTPTTPRTAVSEFLHLQVRREDSSQPIRDVLLCDLWGDDFREAKDNVAACRELSIIKWADRFVLLIDGGKLATSDNQQSAKNDPLMLLRNCLQTGQLGRKSDVDVLITKWDLIDSSTDRDAVIAFVEHVEAEVRARIHDSVRRLRFARVASHPTVGELRLGYGLDAMFPEWVETIWDDAVHQVRDKAVRGESNEFDKYSRRYFSGLPIRG